MTGTLCHRFGPGRLPCTERRDVGGGVAVGATALLVAVLWFAVVSGVRVAVPEGALFGLIQGLGLSSPLVVLGALLAGSALWRYWIPERPDPIRGAVAGGLTVLLALVPVAGGFGLVIAAAGVEAVTFGAVVTAVTDFLVVGIVAYVGSLVLTGWLAVPLGLSGGWYHERARQDRETANSPSSGNAAAP